MMMMLLQVRLGRDPHFSQLHLFWIHLLSGPLHHKTHQTSTEPPRSKWEMYTFAMALQVPTTSAWPKEQQI
eukprot:4145280-Amphidinium_carterae.1